MQYFDLDMYSHNASSMMTSILAHPQEFCSEVMHLADAQKEALSPNHPGELSSEYLLRRGLEYIQQGNLEGGAVLLTLLCEQVSSTQGELFAELDAFRQEYARYRQAQSALQETSIHFARAYAQLQGKVADLTKLGSTLLESIGVCPPMDEREHSPPLSQAALARRQTVATSSPGLVTVRDSTDLPALFITCLGPFEIRLRGTVLPLCSSRSGLRVLRYLVAQPGYSATADVLQTLLWPEDEPEVAQRKLHSAINALRRGLNQGHTCEHEGGYIIYKRRSYALNPALTIRTDVDEFLQLYQAGKRASTERIAYYEQACQLYKRPFLMEDLYEDWSSLQREQLSQTYLTICQALTEHYLSQRCYDDAICWATAILLEDRCDETAHRQLMQIYACQGRRSEALQQYQRCKQILHEELSVQPLPETTRLFQTLLTSGEVLPDEEKTKLACRKNEDLDATLERARCEKKK